MPDTVFDPKATKMDKIGRQAMWSQKIYNLVWKTQQTSKYRKMLISVSGMCYTKLKLSNRIDVVWGSGRHLD